MVKFVKATALLVSLSTAASFGVQSPSSLTTPASATSCQFSSPATVTFSRRTFLPRTLVRGGSIGKSSSSLRASATSDTIAEGNLKILSDRGRKAIQNLIEHDNDGAQTHVYGNWPEPGTDDDGKKKLADQLADLDETYPGGLNAYLSKAKTLLKESAEGINPFEDYEAHVPEGELLSYDGEGSMPFSEAEQKGIEAMPGAAFVLVAGGLGERLGYSGIKLSLETNLCTDECYLEIYIRYIQAMEYLAKENTGRDDIRIPLAIMTSGDTNEKTKELLKQNNYFGRDPDLVTIVMQEKVPALKDGNAGLALKDDDRWTVQTKPHGHGDVHHLLYRDGIVDKWEKEGRTHVIFLQDTNALVINSIIPTLGVSLLKGFHMNSICIPRLAGEAAGAITRLEHKSDPDKSLVINVEYNQLDPLLLSQGDKKGDVPDPATGYSPFPGNANNIVIELGAYAKTLRGEDQGVVVEFVNPKYKDESRTDFKKPTRLECMMQDIPKLFQKEMGREANIGFTMFDRWFTFSPAKNALEAGVADVEKGSTAPGTMSSAESDKYIQNQRKLKYAGADVPVNDKPGDLVKVSGIPITPGPRVILSPAFGITRKEILDKVGGAEKCTISERSSLVLDGHHLKIKNLEVDGALVVRCGENTRVTIDGLKVKNKGWELKELDPNEEYLETIAIRGYTIEKHETAEYILNEPGTFVIGEDGEVREV